MKSKSNLKPAAEWHPQQMPSLLIGRLARLLTKQVDQELAAVGLTVSQLPVLASLKNGAMLTQKELTDLAGVAQPSMAQLLTRMERDGLIERAPSVTDGRTSVISLTHQAKQKLKPGRTALQRVDDEACSILTNDERQMLTTVLLKLLRHMQGNAPL